MDPPPPAWRPVAVFSAWHVFALLFIGSAVSISLQGFEFPDGNNAFHVPVVLEYAGSAEGPHDAFHRSLENYYSGFWILLSYVVDERTVYEAFFILHFLGRLLTLSVLYLIVRTLVPGGDRFFAALTVGALPLFGLALGVTPIGFHGIFGNALTQTSFATTFVLLAWLAALRRKWLLSSGFMAGAFVIVAFVGFWGAFAISAALIWQERGRSIVSTGLRLVRMGAVYFLVALPTVVWIGASLLNASGDAVTYDFREFLLTHFPEHSFLHVQFHDLSKVLLLFVSIPLVLTAIWTSLDTRHRETLAVFCCVLILIFVAGCFLPYVTSNRVLLLLFPLRMDGYLTFLLFICTLSAVNIAMTTARRNLADPSPHSLIAFLSLAHGNLPLLFSASARETGRRRVYAFAGAALIGLGVWVAVSNVTPLHWANVGPPLSVAATLQAGWIFVTVTCLGVPWLVRHDRDATVLSALYPALAIVGMASVTTSGANPWPLAALFIVAGLFYCLPFNNLTLRRAFAGLLLFVIGWSWFSGAPSTRWGPSAAIVGLIVGYGLANRNGWMPRLRPHASVLLLVAGFAAVGVLAVSQSIVQQGLSRQTRLHRAWIEAQMWARANTDPGTLFLTPKHLSGFATLSRRPVWVDWKSGAAANWRPDYFPVWRDRMREVQRLKSSEEWFAYARQNDIDYVVIRLSSFTPAERRSIEAAYRNRVFAVAPVKD